MKKKHSQSSKWFSDVQLNWDAVNSFISDVEVRDNIPAIKVAAEVARKTKSVIAEKSKPQREKISGALEKVFVDRNKHKPSYPESSEAPNEKQDIQTIEEKKEGLIDVVSALDTCAKARKGLHINTIARVHCLYDNIYKTFWFTSRTYTPRELSCLSQFGRFVPQYSDVAIRMQKNEVGTSFQYSTINNIKRTELHNVLLENQSDLQNQTIAIAGDATKYQYRNIQEFLDALRLNRDDIRDIEAKIQELEKQRQGEKDPHVKAQITNSIKKFQEEYRILTLQQEDLKNITIYIRKQGEMRYSHIVDPIQTSIMSENLFDGKTVIIKGGPGTGKTTTMIHRLAYLTDSFAIREDEQNKLNKYKLNSAQRKHLLEAKKAKRDWMFFSPSQMLKEYLSDAMKKEGLENTSEKVWNWKDYCRMVLQDYYHLLETTDNDAPFKICHQIDMLFYQGYDIVKVFTDFYLDQFRGAKTNLPQLNTNGKIFEWTSIAQNIQKRLEEADFADLAHSVSLFNTLESVYGKDCKRLLRERDKQLSELSENICAILDKNNRAKSDIEEIFELASEVPSDEIPEEEVIDEEENEEVGLTGKIQKLLSPVLGNKPKSHKLSGEIQKWLKPYCYGKVSNTDRLSDEQKLMSEILLPLIENKFDDEVQKVGEMMMFEQFAQYTRGIRSIMLNGIPARYKKFRTYLNKTKYEGCNQKLLRVIMQSKQGRELHYQEQSLLLGFINTLVKQIKGSTNTQIKHDYVEAYDEVARPIIGVDEATDFSICDIYAMQSLLTRDFNSLTLCGDIMQRMTSYGIKSWDELDNVLVNPKPVDMKTSYRQSKKLLEVAKQLCIDVLGNTPNYKAFMKSSKVPAPLVFVDEDEHAKIGWISKRISEVYRAYGEQLPSIAIFVTDKGYIPHFIENLQNTEFFKEQKIKVLDGTNSSSIPENHICIYPIEDVKGMEFDVVFFHNIDKSNAKMELVKRYIYVGVSRAAFFLGITMNEENLEISRYFEKKKDWFKI